MTRGLRTRLTRNRLFRLNGSEGWRLGGWDGRSDWFLLIQNDNAAFAVSGSRRFRSILVRLCHCEPPPVGIKAALFARTVSARVSAAWPPLQPLSPFSSAVSCRVPCRRTRRRRGTTRIGTSTWDREGSGSSERGRVFRDFGPWGWPESRNRYKNREIQFFSRCSFVRTKDFFKSPRDGILTLKLNCTWIESVDVESRWFKSWLVVWKFWQIRESIWTLTIRVYINIVY